MVQERCLPSLQAVWKLMQHFVLMPHDVYEEIMRLCWVLIEWDDDIDMKSLWPSYSSHTDALLSCGSIDLHCFCKQLLKRL